VANRRRVEAAAAQAVLFLTSVESSVMTRRIRANLGPMQSTRNALPTVIDRHSFREQQTLPLERNSGFFAADRVGSRR